MSCLLSITYNFIFNIYLPLFVIEYEKRDHFAVKLIMQYKQLQFSKHYLLYTNPIFQISITLAKKVSFLY